RRNSRSEPDWPIRVLKRTEYPQALRDLITQLRQMPGVGPRSAERIALWMVQSRHDQPEQIATAISKTRAQIHPCKLCGFFATDELCEICRDDSRSTDLLCVVEQPTDILRLDKRSDFRERYRALDGGIEALGQVERVGCRIMA